MSGRLNKPVSLSGGASFVTFSANVVLPTTVSRTDDLPVWAQPDPAQPDTLGWRAWVWFPTFFLSAPMQPGKGFLMSPHQHTPWPTAELVAETWSDEEAVRGAAGIHARLLPKKRWQLIGWPDGDASGGVDQHPLLVTGIVERFGRYVLGTTGWRAERVAIKELLAPSTEIGLQLEEKYPDVIVHYPDQYEGDRLCTSERSSASVSANQNQRVQFLLNQMPSPQARQNLIQALQNPQNQAANPPMPTLTGPSVQNLRAGPNCSLGYYRQSETLFESVMKPHYWAAALTVWGLVTLFWALFR